MRLNRRTFAKLIGGVSMLGVAGLAPSILRAQEGEARPGGRLLFGVESEPTTFNGQINGLAKARVVLRNIFEPLFARTQDGGLAPWLAQSYEIEDDGRAYVFTLREGIRFSDGLPLDAEAAALNFERIRDAAYAPTLGGGLIARLEKVEALDARRFRLTLNGVFAPFLGAVSAVELISPAAFDSPELKAGGKSVAGTGPFILETYVRGQEARLVRNPDYAWAPEGAPQQGAALLDEVVFRFLPESAVRIGALQSGQVDVIEGVSGNDASLFQDDEAFTYQRGYNTGAPYSIFFNVESGPTADVAVRKAAGAAVDLDAVLQSVYRGQRTRAWGINSPIEPNVYDASIEGRLAFDPDEANRLLDTAGWTDRDGEGFRTKDGERLSIHLVQSQSTVRDQRDVLLQALQAQLRQNAGIELDVEYVDAGTYTDRRNTGAFGAITNSNAQSDGLDLEYKYLPPEDGGAHFFSRARQPELKELLNEAAATLDPAARKAVYGRLQDFVLLQEAIAFPLYVPEDQIAASAEVKNLRFRTYAQVPESVYGVWLDR